MQGLFKPKLHFPMTTTERKTLLSNVKDFDQKLLQNTDLILTIILLYGDASLDNEFNTHH